jgi:VIT1/CCC1 family predicted Fe2+/Mn2+ transporter
MSPEEEEEELSLIYQAKGIPEDEAAQLAARIIGDPKSALDTLVREELGLDPEELGSPGGAAGSSFVAFTAGAIIPLLPFLFGLVDQPAIWSAAVSALALFGVGAAVSVFTAGGVIRSGLRMVVIGLVAAAATFGIGRLLGVAVTG